MQHTWHAPACQCLLKISSEKCLSLIVSGTIIVKLVHHKSSVIASTNSPVMRPPVSSTDTLSREDENQSFMCNLILSIHLKPPNKLY